MTNKFSFITDLKKRNKDDFRDAFIEAAEIPEKSTVAKKRIKKENILLVISGRAQLDEYAKPTYLYLRNDILEDIKKHCTGTKQSIINYLLRRGLDSLIESNEFIHEENI
jgi:hypothetical protein